MRIITLTSAAEKMQGLQYKRFIEDDTLWVFRDIGQGDYFHSENVPEPFDIAFVSWERRVLLVARMVPPKAKIEVPEGTSMAMEAKAGNMARWGIVQGSVVSL
jgi:uncharacterized membrane protein (UPF0127 family)